MKGYLYILKSNKNKRYYLGSTNNLIRRVHEHNTGQNKSTRTGCPWELIFTQEYSSYHEARGVEAKLKSFKSKIILERIVLDGIVKLGS